MENWSKENICIIIILTTHDKPQNVYPHLMKYGMVHKMRTCLFAK